jgi:MoaA/NifB/PqqE/SkfB family radical SAM enzyme
MKGSFKLPSNLFAPFVHSKEGQTLFDNTNRLARISYRTNTYIKMVSRMVGYIPVTDMLRSHFPFVLPDAAGPAFLTVEFTNYCNLRCPYCPSPLGLRKRGFMDRSTFSNLLLQVKELGVNRVRIVGNGESTLHRAFPSMLRAIAQSTKFVQLVTNGQRLSDDNIDAILTAPVRLLDISVDSNDKEGYERSRIGGNFERLLDNLKRLKERKRNLRTLTLTNIRVMLRPSERANEQEIIAFWRGYADTVMPQYIIQDKAVGDIDPDVYISARRDKDSYPRCTVPFKSLVVYWNGNVPLCGPSYEQTGFPEGI